MRKATFIVMLGIAVAVVAGMSSITWKTTSIDLGEVSKNELKELSFEFTNNSNSAIRILEAKGSCGCTNVKFPEGEIDPGETASITANFKSAKVGAFKKNIRIKTSDSDDYTYLHFNGEVVE
ncbi:MULTISPECIES: DUF1573 domain-containing protein [unclassified Ekhidna]|jgi:hypothetical protein|uniref:DUF1573 domain-containing protein n=1 Tax=unclassified Ekhidna TaxID=2632188 RepID=UPI0032DF7A22